MKEIQLQSKLQKALDIINQELDKVSEISDINYRTSGSFQYNEKKIDITKCMSINPLIDIISIIGAKNDHFQQAVERLKLKQVPVFKFAGYCLNDWIHDCSLRISIIRSEEIIKELESKKARLMKFMDKNTELTMILEEFGLNDI